MKSVYYSALHIIRNQWVSTSKGLALYFIWQWIRRFSKYPLRINVADGIQIEFSTANLALEGGTKLYTQGLYDGNNMRLLKWYFERNDALFWDVGSNIGLYALITTLNPKAKAVAFEPHPFTFQLLNQQIALNHRENILPVNVGLSNLDGQVQFLNVAGSSTNSIVLDANNNAETIAVPVVQADSIIQSEIPHIVKIDVEGFEREVLLGFQNNISQVKLLIVEVSKNRDEVFQFFKNNGFVGPLEIDLIQKVYRPYQDGKSMEDPVWINEKSLHEFEELIQQYAEK